MKCIVQLTDMELVAMSAQDVIDLAGGLGSLPQADIWEISVKSNKVGNFETTYKAGNEDTNLEEILREAKGLFNTLNGG